MQGIFLDGIDRKIIEALKIDSRTTFLSIAKKIEVSEGTIRQRVSKMISKGIIKKFTIELGTQTTALVEIQTSSKIPTKKISESILKSGADKVFEVTGDTTIIAQISAENLTKLNEIIERIRAIEGVTQTETFPVLKEYA
jgi:DNA-binding Lrp family transcriptional regulator